MSHHKLQGAGKVRWFLLTGIEVLASVVLIAMMLQVVTNAVTRTIWREPVFGTLEVTQFYYLPILALLGLAAAQARDEHIVADLLFDSFPPIARRITTVVVNLLSAVVTGLIGWFAIGKFEHALDRGVTAGNTDIQVWPVHLFMAIAYAIFTIQLLAVAYLTVTGRPSAPGPHDEVDEILAELDPEAARAADETGAPHERDASGEKEVRA